MRRVATVCGVPYSAYHDAVLHVSAHADPPGLSVAGDVDTRTRDMFARALAALPTDAEAVHLDLAGLTFIDLDGLRQVLDTAERLSAHSRLVVHHLPWRLLEIVHLTGWQDTPGLEIVDGESQ